MKDITVTLTGEQREWMQAALRDALVHRQQEDPDYSDGAYEDVDAPMREHALALAELFRVGIL